MGGSDYTCLPAKGFLGGDVIGRWSRGRCLTGSFILLPFWLLSVVVEEGRVGGDGDGEVVSHALVIVGPDVFEVTQEVRPPRLLPV